MCIIKYETNGGSEIEDMSIVQGGDFIFPTAPHKSGHKFAGWYLDNETFNESALHLMDKKLNSDHILYAKWIDEDMEVNPMVCITMINGKKIRLELYPDIAPVTVQNFLYLVDENYYENTVFHRIIANFMIQAGNIEFSNDKLFSKEQRAPIIGEFSSNGVNNNIKHTLGVISMARIQDDKDSASTQFFICSATSTHLDGEYAAFGKTIDTTSNHVITELSNYATTTVHGMENFPFDSDGYFVIISSIERIII